MRATVEQHSITAAAGRTLLAHAARDLRRLRATRGAGRRTARALRQASARMLLALALIGAPPLSPAVSAADEYCVPGSNDSFGLSSVFGESTPTFADIDADGDLDALVGNTSGDTHLFLNTGISTNPGFSAPLTNPFGFSAVTLDSRPALVDIDADGDLDAFIGHYLGGIQYFDNTGTAALPAFAGSVNPLGSVDVGLESSPAFADLDGDGDFDALIGEDAGNTIFFANTGTAALPAFDAGSLNPFGLVDVGDRSAPAIADFDGDGDLDVFVGESYGNVVFFRNTGTAATPAFEAPSTNPFGIPDVGDLSVPALADIDADGDLDIFVGESGGTVLFVPNFFLPNAGNVFGAPNFVDPVTNGFGLTDIGLFASPELADIDGDGDFDAFFGEYYGNVVFFRNTGTALTPTFAAPSTNPFDLAGVGVRSAPVFADLDGDGDLDALVGDGTGNAVFFHNVGDAYTPIFDAASTNPFGLTDVGASNNPELADVDGDGDLDALVGNYGGNFVFFRNTGTDVAPMFAAASLNPFGLSSTILRNAPTLADVDGDGDLDVIAGVISGSTLVFENTGTATAPAFAAGVADPFGLIDVGSSVSPELGDLDGDGDIDVLTGDLYGNTVMLTNRIPHLILFGSPSTNPFGLSHVVGDAGEPALADIDGDGDFDVFSGNHGGETLFFENTGTSFSPGFAVPMTNPFGLVSILTGADFLDIDGDSDLDVFLPDSSGNTIFQRNTGSSAVPAFEAPSTNPFGLAIVPFGSGRAFTDIDGDGDFDALTEDLSDVVYFENTGTATSPAFAAPSPNPFGLPVWGLSVQTFGDLDRDGRIDAITGDPSGDVVFFRNTGTVVAAAFGAEVLLPNDAFMRPPALADIDGDGDLDAFFDEGGDFIFFRNGCAGSPPPPTPTPTETSAPSATPTPTPTSTPPSASCPSTPATGCQTGGSGKLIIKDNADDTKDKLVWKFGKGPQLLQSDFGDPVTTNAYGFCVYDDDVLKIDLAIPSGPPWEDLSTRGYQYKDSTGTNDGVTKVKLVGGDVGRSKLQVKGKGVGLAVPAPASGTQLLSGSTSVVAQLHGNGDCWETSFDPAESTHKPNSYKGKR